MANIANLAVQLTTRTASFTTGMQKATKDLNLFSRATRGTSRVVAALSSHTTAMAIAAATAAAGAIAATIAIRALVNSQREAIDSTSKLAERLQIGTHDLVAMQLGAELAGVSSESLTTGLERYTKTVGEASRGSKEAQDKFTRLGLSAKNLASMGTADAIGAIADRINLLPNAYAKAAAMQDIFGKGGQELLNWLKDGSAGMDEARAKAEKYGLAFSEIDGKKIEEMNDTLTETSMVFKGLVNNYLIRLAPLITEAANAFIDFATEGTRANDAFNKSFEVLSKATRVFGEGLITLRMLGNLFAGGFLFAVNVIRFAIDSLMIGITKSLNGLIAVNNALNPLAKLNPFEEWDYSGTNKIAKFGSKFIKAAADARKELDKAITESVIDPNATQRRLAESANKIVAGANARAQDAIKGPLNSARTASGKRSQGLGGNSAAVANDFVDTDELDRLQESASKVFKETRSPFENFTTQTEELDGLLQKGLINWDTYSRGVRQAGDEMKKTTKSAEKMNKAQHAQDFGQFTALTMVANDKSGRYRSVNQGGNGIKPVTTTPITHTSISHRSALPNMQMERVGDVGRRNEDVEILRMIDQKLARLVSLESKSGGIAYAG